MSDYNFFGNVYAPREIKLTCKKDYIQYHIREKFSKTIRMFEYTKLPDTLTPRDLEIGLQYNGVMVAIKENGKVYILWGSLGGRQNQNYMPTIAIIANPYLNLSKTYTIGKDCVVIPNDSLYRGLLPLHAYYATRDAENDISLNAILKNMRANVALVTRDSSTLEDCKQFLKDLDEGKTRAIFDKSFEDGLQALSLNPSQSNQTIIQLLEAIQYNKGSWWNEVGVQSNYNMKRETITANENILNVDSLLPRLDDMYECRKKAFKEIEEMFGEKIEFDFGSSWAKLRKEIKMSEQEIKPVGEQSDKQSRRLDKGEVGEKNETNNDN